MGRKKGQQQRTKGNVLPSSSVRSADLLTKEGANAGLGLFQSLPSAALGNLPELTGLDSIPNIEFRTLLKKLYKRDVTTKLKALAELSELCSTVEQHEVLTILPYWPRIYNRLFEDSDRRVRENAQKAMRAIVPVAGKSLALQLKNVMGCWFVSQCDPYAPAALTAESAISEAFSGKKKVAAFVFCRTDILGCISAFVFSPLAKKDSGVEGDGNNYHRIVASCLEALSLYLKVVSKENPNDDEIERFLCEAQFWKFQKHSNLPVRGGYYSVLESLCLVSVSLASKHLNEICRSIFHRLDEENAIVCKPLYAAAVAVAAKCDSWCQNIDIHKGLVAGLRNSLKAGCYGLGTFVLPTLLPILANISGDLDTHVIFSKILEGMRQCISHDLVRQSKRGSELAVTSFMEIINLSVRRITSEFVNSDTQILFCQALVKEYLMFVVGECCLESCGRFVTAAGLKFVPRVINLLESQKSRNNPVCSMMCDVFWDEVASFTQKFSFVDKNLGVTDRITMFFSNVVNPAPIGPAKHSVKFDGDCQTNVQTHTQNEDTKNVEVLSPDTHERIRRNVNSIMVSCKFAHPLKASNEMLLFQLKIFEKLGEPDLFSNLLQHSNVSSEQRQEDGVALYIETVLFPQVFKLADEASCGDQMLHTLSGIIFHVIKHCQSSSYMPCDIAPFFHGAETARFEVILHFLFAMLTNIDAKIGEWLHGFINDDSDCKILEVLHSAVQAAGSCSCSSVSRKSILYGKKCWEILRLLLNSSYKSEESGFVSVCDPKLVSQTIENIFSALDGLKKCQRCYEGALNNLADLMLLLVNRNLGGPIAVSDGDNMWHKLLTDLFKLYFVAEEPAAVHCRFENLLLLAAQRKKPFIGESEIVVSKYVQSLASWVQGRIFESTNENIQRVLTRARPLLNTLLEVLDGNEDIIGLACHLLPSSKKWDEVRNFDTASLGIDLLHHSILDVDGIPSDSRFVSAFEELIQPLMTSDNKRKECISWVNCSNYICLVEECILFAVVTSDVMLQQFAMRVPREVQKIVWTRIMERSLKEGGIWALALKTLCKIFECGETISVFEQFSSSLRKSEINCPLFQTIFAALGLIPNEQVCEIIKDILTKLMEQKPDDVSISNQYAFSFGIAAVCNVSCEDHPSLVQMYLKLVSDWKIENASLFLLDDHPEELTEEAVTFNGCIAIFFSYIIKQCPESISEDNWDFIQCALLSWIETAASFIGHEVLNTAALSLLSCSCTLLQAVDSFMSSSVAQEDPTIPTNLVSEWTGFFSSAINTPLFKIFIHLSSSNVCLLLLSDICRCLRSVTAESIIACASDLKPKLTSNSFLPDDVQTIFNHLGNLLTSKYAETKQHLLVITASYQFIFTMIDRLVALDSETAPEEVLNVLRKVSVVVKSVFEVEETTLVKSEEDAGDSENDDHPYEHYEEYVENESSFEEDLAVESSSIKHSLETESTSVILYLLIWKILIKLTHHVSAEKKTTYINNILRNTNPNLSDDVLPKLFRIMIAKKSHFQNDPDLFLNETVVLDDIEHLAASVYKDFLIEMPAASRAWYNELPKTIRSRVDKFTSVNVSPTLIENEFKAVRATASQQNKDGMEINARPTVREVHAAYQLNELKMEIAVCLPPNHPLGPIVVNTEKRAGVVVGQWRYWLLQITSFLQYQNGGIIDGLLMWKERVDKKFEGMEECMICFSVVHGNNQSLPKLRCKTCKKKYHAECLYKWFDTSNNSTCPLCRSPMIFR